MHTGVRHCGSAGTRDKCSRLRRTGAGLFAESDPDGQGFWIRPRTGPSWMGARRGIGRLKGPSEIIVFTDFGLMAFRSSHRETLLCRLCPSTKLTRSPRNRSRETRRVSCRCRNSCQMKHCRRLRLKTMSPRRPTLFRQGRVCGRFAGSHRLWRSRSADTLPWLQVTRSTLILAIQAMELLSIR